MDRGLTVHYVLLGGAIAAELIATSLMKATDGFTRFWPTLAVLAGYAISFVLLARAVKGIEVGVAYAIWSAVGTAAIVAIGAVFLGEPLTTVKVAGIALIIAGVVMLNLNASGAH
ncbi:multidrug efflux SMR transporter [Actinoplanes campanulatus]|uniref:DMT family transporter n=1 Tax=Actinoplanes campanulatus TaxID=113559 RepID=UPI0031DDE1C8